MKTHLDWTNLSAKTMGSECYDLLTKPKIPGNCLYHEYSHRIYRFQIARLNKIFVLTGLYFELDLRI